MTTKMIDAITITRNKIFKGAARILRKDSDMTWPTKLEDIMNPASPATGSAYALASGWEDLGGTTDDGVTVSRSASLSDGIVVDQRNTPLDKGEPETWEMEAEATLLDTSIESIQNWWQGGTLTAIAGSGTNVAQHSLSLDAPSTITSHMVAFIQEDPLSGELRAIAFRSAKPKVDKAELVFKSKEATGIPLALTIDADETVSEGDGQFGMIFEED